MPTTKKVILFIVEGASDKSALNPVLKNIFQSSDIRFHVVHGDITANRENDKLNINERILECVNIESYRYKLLPNNIAEVIHLIDTDGAFIPDTAIEKDATKTDGFSYENDKILAKDRQEALNRNHGKQAILNKLRELSEIVDSECEPGSKNKIRYNYSIYYFSRNLEHILHGEHLDIDTDTKFAYADDFADKYGNDPQGFIDFMSNSTFTVKGDYKETCTFITQGTNSLHRHSNFHLLLKDKDLQPPVPIENAK